MKKTLYSLLIAGLLCTNMAFAEINTVGIGASTSKATVTTFYANVSRVITQYFQNLVGSSTGTTTAGSFFGNIASFFEINVQNRNASSSASSDLVATANNGDANSHYIDLGINNSGGGSMPFPNAGEGYLYIPDSNLNIGAITNGGFLKFFAGSSTTPAGYFATSTFYTPTMYASTTYASSSNPANLIVSASSTLLGTTTIVNDNVISPNSGYLYIGATTTGTNVGIVTIGTQGGNTSSPGIAMYRTTSLTSNVENLFFGWSGTTGLIQSQCSGTGTCRSWSIRSGTAGGTLNLVSTTITTQPYWTYISKGNTDSSGGTILLGVKGIISASSGGTVSPQTILRSYADISQTSTATFNMLDVFANIITKGAASSSNFLQTWGYTFNGNGTTTAMLLDLRGYLGIGTTTPTSVLSVAGTSTLNGVIVQTSASAQAGQAMCYATGGVLGHCTSAVGAGGACTCVAN